MSTTVIVFGVAILVAIFAVVLVVMSGGKKPQEPHGTAKR